jgi:hypothetical protein
LIEMMNDPVGRFLAIAKSKSDLHAAIDALPDDAQLILIANACCCGNPDHAAGTGNLVFHAAYGQPTLLELVGMLRLTEHALISAAD